MLEFSGLILKFHVDYNKKPESCIIIMIQYTFQKHMTILQIKHTDNWMDISVGFLLIWLDNASPCMERRATRPSRKTAQQSLVGINKMLCISPHKIINDETIFNKIETSALYFLIKQKLRKIKTAACDSRLGLFSSSAVIVFASTILFFMMASLIKLCATVKFCFLCFQGKRSSTVKLPTIFKDG